mmetsp:Transcript_175999/g.564387  ORF Transcript_175999/g.564387 Transcript_175999/m.564387 type:complete len:384 (-) Transcript_175999:81-1232(-)
MRKIRRVEMPLANLTIKVDQFVVVHPDEPRLPGEDVVCLQLVVVVQRILGAWRQVEDTAFQWPLLPGERLTIAVLRLSEPRIGEHCIGVALQEVRVVGRRSKAALGPLQSLSLVVQRVDQVDVHRDAHALGCLPLQGLVGQRLEPPKVVCRNVLAVAQLAAVLFEVLISGGDIESNLAVLRDPPAGCQSLANEFDHRCCPLFVVLEVVLDDACAKPPRCPRPPRIQLCLEQNTSNGSRGRRRWHRERGGCCRGRRSRLRLRLRLGFGRRFHSRRWGGAGHLLHQVVMLAHEVIVNLQHRLEMLVLLLKPLGMRLHQCVNALVVIVGILSVGLHQRLNLLLLLRRVVKQTLEILNKLFVLLRCAALPDIGRPRGKRGLRAGRWR